MKLHGVIELHVNGEAILRKPRFWDRVVKRFGGEPDLRTGNVRAQLEAQAVVDAAQQAFKRLGATNAVSLVIDNQVLFQDRDSRMDDLGDLFLAFHDNASVFGGSFSLLRLAIEHQEAGVHYVVEIIARTEHPTDEAAARVVVSGRIKDFEPRPGEDADAYRARVEPLTRDRARVETARAAFDSFVHRVADTLRAVMPEARVEIQRAQAVVQKPTRRPAPERAVPPTDPRYDPHEVYYPNPMYGMLSGLMWANLFATAMLPGFVVDGSWGEAGSADGWGDAGAGDADGHADHDGDYDGDVGDGDFGGGDFDGGDFGGGDFGGGDW